MTSTETTVTGERADLFQSLDQHRGFLRSTWVGQFRMAGGETLAGLLADYKRVAEPM